MVFRIAFLLLLLTFILQNTYTQVSISGIPESFTIRTKSAPGLPEKILDEIDTFKLVTEDKESGIYNRYSAVQSLEINIKENGLKTEIAGKGFIWRYQIFGVRTYSLGLFFSNYHVPEGAKLFIYDETHTYLKGAFSSINNKENNQLAIAEFKGNNAIIEYYEPFNVDFEGILVLGSVSQSYRDITSILEAAVERVGINCEEGELWQDEKRSVCRMTFIEGRYGYYCTGFLVNNIKQDGTPYFMTANHCISNNTAASTLITYFNYENSTCGSTDAKANQTISGASLKATNTDSDFSLLLLSEVPPVSYKAYLAGWQAGNRNPQSGTSIHHPEGMVKNISIDSDPPESYPQSINWDDISTTPPNTHWGVKFEVGTTESGSSGSPLFDDNHRVIGQLHGGDEIESFYGKFSVSWNRSSIASRQLKAWLDPDNSGAISMNGSYFTIKPTAAFSVRNSEACINSVVQLEDESKNFPQTWLWKIEPSDFIYVNGTGSYSQNPEVEFSKEGIYSVQLITSNDYGADTLLSNNLISVSSQIDVFLTGIPSDTFICGSEIKNYPIIAKGAESYNFSVEQQLRFNYSAFSDTLLLTLKETVMKYGSFNTKIKVTGSLGECYDSDSINLKVAMPVNDNIENAIKLWPGINGIFSNFCGSAENHEPYPILSSCYSSDTWCPESDQTTIDNSLWFTFIGPSNGLITIETGNINSQIAVYEAASDNDILSGNSSLYEIIAANDDQSPQDESSKIENLEVSPGKEYWLQVDGTNGATGDFSISLLSNSIELFPNPSNGNFDIIISSFYEGKTDFTIFNNLGKEIYAEQLEISHDNNRFNFDFSNFPTGVYFVKVRAGESTLTKKLIIY